LPKKVCFCDCECAGTDISQKDEKQTKTGKNEHESGTSQKVKAWHPKVKDELILSKEILRV
jgi:hypothetical protein